jgi:predicted peptidase
MGRALMGTLRAMELAQYRRRLHTMGDSGGARSGHMLTCQYPHLYADTVPLCGAN